MEQQTVLTYLDGYCERAGHPEFWAEPLNALTNICFIIAAWAALRALKRQPNHNFRATPDSWLLIAALFSIGVGSFLFHTIPNGHTVLMDVLPITLFINIYLIAALRRFLRLGWVWVAVLWAAYTAIGVVAQVQLPPDTLNGTIMYIPTYATLILLTAAIARVDKAAGRGFAGVLLLWTASLTFRTLDLDICEHFPVGTHFLWHAFNAVVLYRLLRLLMARA